MFALSTAWNADRWQDGTKIAQEILELGIKHVELGFSLTKPMVDDIYRFSQQNNLTITSLHNYCPIPDGFLRTEALPDCYSLSSLDNNERKNAVEHTKNTINTAQKLRARAVVLHCGRVEMKDRTRELIQLCASGQKNSNTFKEIFHAFVQERAEKAPAYVAQICKSLEELCGYAQQHDIVLGIENRFYYREIPSFNEFEIIFNRFKNKPVVYWHDVGHGFIFEKCGFSPPGALLKKYGRNLYGTHLHNIKNFADHQSPIEGEFDFQSLKTFIGKNTLKIIEAHAPATANQIKESIHYLEGILDD